MATETTINQDDLRADTIVLQLSDIHKISRNVVTTRYKIDTVEDIGRPDKCLVIINTMKYSVAMSYADAVAYIYGAEK